MRDRPIPLTDWPRPDCAKKSSTLVAGQVTRTLGGGRVAFWPHPRPLEISAVAEDHVAYEGRDAGDPPGAADHDR